MLNKKLSFKKVYHNDANCKGIISLSIVWADTGKRLKISTATLKHLGNPSQVAFAENEEGTGVYLQATESGGYCIGKAGTVYASSLIKGLIDDFHLDFTQKSCHTYSGEPGIEPDTKKTYAEFLLKDDNCQNKERAS